MQQIAVRGVNLDAVDPKPRRPFGPSRECLAYACKARRIERLGRRFTLLMRHGGWGVGEPAALGWRDQLAAFPGDVARRLPPGMGELHRHGDLRMFADRGKHRRQRRLGGVVKEAQILRRDAALGFHGRRLEAQHAGAGKREMAEVDHVPCGRPAVFGRILAHGRHDDAIGESDAPQREWRKQCAHEAFQKEEREPVIEGPQLSRHHSRKRSPVRGK